MNTYNQYLNCRGTRPPSRVGIPPSRCSIPPSRFSVPPSRFSVPPSRFSIPPSRFKSRLNRRKRAGSMNISHKFWLNLVPNCGEDFFLSSLDFGNGKIKFPLKYFCVLNALGQGCKSVPPCKILQFKYCLLCSSVVISKNVLYSSICLSSTLSFNLFKRA